uniref:IgGFc-binding protein N-terminal domain-containing protein n=1 Tax=Acrobeloides nanus TaxID=290746 RepID=A0A914DH53_9BILA
MTGGDFFYSSGKSVVANLLPYYLPTLYRTAHLGTIFVQNCSDETVYFPIDSGTQAFSVSYTGPGAGGLTMTVTDSNNTVVPLPEGYQLYEYTYFAAFDYLNTLSNPPGTWKLEVKSTARNCVLTVRLRSTIEVFAGFTNQTDSDLLAGALKDNPRALLAVDTPNGIILHANNLGNGTLNYVQIYGGGDRVLFSSELIKRIGCNYEWWAPSSFTCAYGLYIVSV